MANPLYGSNRLDKKINQAYGIVGDDGGEFNFGSLPQVGSSIGLDTAIARHDYDDGLRLLVQNIGTQTTVSPISNAAGMDYSYGNTNNLGVQWALADPVAKEYHSSGPRIDRYVVGSDAFFCELRWSIADVDGADEMAFGFRKVEAFQAAIDDYDEMACLNSISGDIKSETILNDGATTTTDLTSPSSGDWADGATHKVKVLVSAAGAVTYKLDETTPGAAAAFSFDSGEIITPFFYYLNDSNVAGAVVLQKFKHGRQ
jgi:hypothetical protein